MPKTMTISQACRAFREELKSARKKFGPMNSGHEAYAVILKEIEEFWADVKRDDPIQREMIQIGAMALATLTELPMRTDYEVRTGNVEHDTAESLTEGQP